MKEKVSLKNRKIIPLYIADIDCSRFCFRRDIESDLTSAFVDSVNDYGIIQSPYVVRIKEEYFLISGFRRIAAAKESGIDKVDCFVVEGSMAPLLGFFENEHHLKLRPIERAEGIKKLFAMFECSQKDFAERIIMLSPQTMSDELKIASLPLKIKNDDEANSIIPKRDLLKVARIKDPEEQWEAYEKIKGTKQKKGRSRKKPKEKTLKAITEKMNRITFDLMHPDLGSHTPKDHRAFVDSLKLLNAASKKIKKKSDASEVLGVVRHLFIKDNTNVVGPKLEN